MVKSKTTGPPKQDSDNRWILIEDQNLHLQEPKVAPTDNGGGFTSRDRVHAYSKPQQRAGKRRGMEGKREKKRTLELEDEWGKDELAM